MVALICINLLTLSRITFDTRTISSYSNFIAFDEKYISESPCGWTLPPTKSSSFEVAHLQGTSVETYLFSENDILAERIYRIVERVPNQCLMILALLSLEFNAHS